MGSWHETCFISNLPIEPGDKVRLFFGSFKKKDMSEYFHYPCDLCSMISLPLKAEYDDYGRYELYDNDEFIISLTNDFINSSINNPEENIDISDQFIYDQLHDKKLVYNTENYKAGCYRRAQAILKVDKDNEDAKKQIEKGLPEKMYDKNYIFIAAVHESIFKQAVKASLLKNVFEFCKFGEKPLPPFKKRNALKLINKFNQEINKYKNIFPNSWFSSLSLSPQSFGYLKLIRSWSMNDTGISELFNQKNVLELFQEYDEERQVNILRYIHDLFYFITYMSICRKLFAPQSGAGSQSTNYDMHEYMNEKTMKFVTKRRKKEDAYYR